MFFKKLLSLSLTVIFIFIISLYLSHPILSDETTEALSSKIAEYDQKLIELSKAKDTLANQLKIITSQIELTILKINQTQSSIKTLTAEIDNLSTEIGKLDISLNHLSSVYIEQVNQNYRLTKRTSPLSMLLTSNSFNGFLEQYKYISLIQKNSQDTLVNLETVRTNYDIQKNEKEKKQLELVSLQKKLSEQEISLDKQKNNKTSLLAITKNDETKYQSLKKAAENELSSLLKAQFVGKRIVKKGEPLGIMGNSGYSFGDHLHFGLYNLKESELASWIYQNDIDSSDYIKNNIWPMLEPIEITQGRGNTKYSYLYADHFHHGIDMVSSNKTVRAVNDGMAYFFRNPSSSLGNHVKLFHSDGKMTLYLHLQ